MRQALVCLLSTLLGAALVGCDHDLTVQAPTDGYVCANSSFQQCLAKPAPATVDALRKTLYGNEFVAGSSTAIQDKWKPDSQKCTSDYKTSGGQKGYCCNYDGLSYTPQLKPDQVQSVVVVLTCLASEDHPLR